jgi:hypothetical protein
MGGSAGIVESNVGSDVSMAGRDVSSAGRVLSIGGRETSILECECSISCVFDGSEGGTSPDSEANFGCSSGG